MMSQVMTRVMIVGLVLATLVMTPVHAVAQEATPTSAEAALAEPLDLPALMLTPEDLAMAGFPGYGLAVSTLAIGPALVVQQYADGRLPDEQMALFTESLRSAGIQRSYENWLSISDPQSGELIRDIVSYVEEYADANGAAQGLEVIVLVNAALDPDAQEIAGTRALGEGSILVRYGAEPESGTPNATPAREEAPRPQWIDLTFRLGAMNVGAKIVDYTGQSPEIADVEALASFLLAKIERERGREAPGLSLHGLRLDPAEYSFDSYVRRDGETLPMFGESDESLRLRNARYGLATDAYLVSQYIPAGEDDNDNDDISVQNLVSRFADEAAASAYIAELPVLLEADPNLDDVVVLEESLDLGNESVTLTYTRSVPEVGTSHLVRLTVRDGAEVTTLAMSALDADPPLAAAETLALAALECLRAEGWCPVVPVPADLIPQGTPAP